MAITPILMEQSSKSQPRKARSRCLICATTLPKPGHNRNYHEACALEFFGTVKPPTFAFNASDFQRLAIRSISSGIAVAGVQPKLPVFYPEGASYFIVKPQVEGVRSVPEFEHLWMRLYSSLGVIVAKSCLIEASDGSLAYMTKRFDRSADRKFHVEDFGQLLGKSILANEKFDGRIADIATMLRTKSSPRLRVLAVTRLYELTVLNIVFGNSDAPLKNHSIIGLVDSASPSGISYTLAPAYDLLPTTFLGQRSVVSSALRINGKTSNLTRKDLMAEASACGVKPRAYRRLAQDGRGPAGEEHGSPQAGKRPAKVARCTAYPAVTIRLRAKKAALTLAVEQPMLGATPLGCPEPCRAQSLPPSCGLCSAHMQGAPAAVRPPGL